MPRKHHQPTYRKHKATGQAVVTLNGRDFYLGPYGSEASRAEYDRRIAEWLGNGRTLPAATLTVAELIRRFWDWVETPYRKADGTPTSEVCQFRYTLRPLNHLFGATPAADFGPLKLKAVRKLMIDGYEHPRYQWQRPCSRDVINKRINRIKLMYRWATENELIPTAVFHGLSTVRGIQRGRTEAKETEPVRPVPESLLAATRPFLSATVEAMVDVQLLSGARPGEVCAMRACDLDMTGQIWTYRPETHKNDHRGQCREIYLGPRAQAVIKRFLKSDSRAPLFSPQHADTERQAKRRKLRKTPLYPSHVRHMVTKRKKIRRRPLRDLYDVASYRRAISYACKKAFPIPTEFAPRIKPDGKRESHHEWQSRLTPDQKVVIDNWRREHTWHPHQLRHNAGTNLRKEFGVELARIILGHATAFTTEIYAEADRRHAMEIVGKIG